MIPKSNRSLLSLEQLEDEVVEERGQILREWFMKSTLDLTDYALSINCIEVECDDMNRCPCKGLPGKVVQHFEIPPLVESIGRAALLFVGSTDRQTSYYITFNLDTLKYQKYRKNKQNRPYVYVEKFPNKNGFYDCWLFNAPMVKYVSVVGIFRDPRQLEGFNCCESTEYLEMGGISNEIIRRLLAKKTNLYRTLPPPTSQIAD